MLWVSIATGIDDLDVLVDYITDSGNGRISLDKTICSKENLHNSLICVLDVSPS